MTFFIVIISHVDARSRLTTAVGQLLDLMERSTVQLMEAKATQQELLDTLAARAQELESTTNRTAELDSQLAAEIQAKDYLGLELHKAEGMYTKECSSFNYLACGYISVSKLISKCLLFI